MELSQRRLYEHVSEWMEELLRSTNPNASKLPISNALFHPKCMATAGEYWPNAWLRGELIGKFGAIPRLGLALAAAGHEMPLLVWAEEQFHRKALQSVIPFQGSPL